MHDVVNWTQQLDHQLVKFAAYACTSMSGKPSAEIVAGNMPSAPTGVVHTGVPCAQLSTILPFKPAPNRRGARHTRYWCITSSDGANPFAWTPAAYSSHEVNRGSLYAYLVQLFKLP